MDNFTLTLLETLDGASDIDINEDDNIAWAEYLSLEQPYTDEAKQAAAWMLGTHADSIDLVDAKKGAYALYRAIYREERNYAEGEPNLAAEEAMRELGEGYGEEAGSRLCGQYLLVTPAE